MKTKFIVIRVDAKIKNRISVVSRREGKSISAFMLERAMSHVALIEAKVEEHQANDKFKKKLFSSLSKTAQSGGAIGYREFGYELAKQLRVRDSLKLISFYEEAIPRRRRDAFVEGIERWVRRG